MKKRAIFACAATIVLSACGDEDVASKSLVEAPKSEGVPGSAFVLTENELQEELKAAKSGSVDAIERLALHYEYTGDLKRAKMYREKCLARRSPICLSDEAGRLYTKYTLVDSEQEKRQMITAALNYSRISIENTDPRDSRLLASLREQERIIHQEYNIFNSVYSKK
ncbi:hypothetical protein [Porphyrobacter sp. YT40]|uniref:hypothetical protein n=1 Tax=Porphyrobacter sp. YT40 TaxID=2547601 RepID=UPI001144A7F3|nr:hypothetical protein [Porphyrobacter sp. YT40]QDH34051.1 hypothetical protein E2E27_06715 [Porphyrobacter sp. YT40]